MINDEIDDESISLGRSAVKPALPGPWDSPPPAEEVAVEFGAWSRRGPSRAVNDDHYLVLRLGRHQETLMTSLPAVDVPQRFDEYGYGMVIADGMGAAGEPASRLAITTLVRLAIEFGRWHLRVTEPIAHEVVDRAERFYRSVDSTLLQASYNGNAGLRTTLSAVFSAGSELFFAHVGHSRAYLFRDDKLTQLTRDHTLSGEHPGKALILEVSDGAQDQHHIVTKTLGAGGAGRLRLDIERCGLLDGDRVLLCTNGLTDVITDDGISSELRAHGMPDDQSRALVNLAAELGGTDDVTALVAHYRIRPRAEGTLSSHS
jgi:PPM family protein phosphatase